MKSSSPRARLRSLAVAAAVVGLSLAGSAPAHGAASDGLVPAPTAKGAWTARLVASTAAREKPWSRRVVEHLSTRTMWSAGPTQLLVLDSMIVKDPNHDPHRRLWLKVALPIRPNGTTGWIRADSAQLSRTAWRVAISTTRRTALVYRAGVLVRRFRVVVGAPRTPTPHGLFAVYEAVRQRNPHGFIGPWALHLTAFSNVLDNYGGGPGRVAMHGRDGASLRDPLGSARSHGCIRMANSAVRFLAKVLRPGAPVRIGR
jgi:hypothetical protein